MCATITPAQTVFLISWDPSATVPFRGEFRICGTRIEPREPGAGFGFRASRPSAQEETGRIDGYATTDRNDG